MCVQHAQIGNDESSVKAQVWPLRSCHAIAEGCEMLIASRQRTLAYPTDARQNLTCKACKHHLDQLDHRHTRVPGECRYAAAERGPAVIWKCPACVAQLPLTHPDHTWVEGECRALEMRGSAAPQERRGAAETREPRILAAMEPTMAQRPGPPAPDSADAEAAELAEAASAAASNAAPAASSDAAPAASSDAPLGAAPSRDADEQDEEEPARLSSSRGASSREPQRRPRAAVAEMGTQADEEPEGWQSFSLGRALKLLHSLNQGVVRRTLRRLHVRFLHMSTKRMQELLRHAGAPQSAIKTVPEIVETCRVCRMWTRPTARSMTRTRLAQ